MLGPLPKLHRLLVSTAAVLVFAIGGAWAAFKVPYPVLVSVGASIGLAVGAVCAYLLVHQPVASPQRRRRLP